MNATEARSHGVVWFRRDLRLDDNPAWSGATARHDRITALYVLDARLLGAAGSHRRRQHVAELHALDATLREHGGRLLVRTGDPATIVCDEAQRLGVDAVWWNSDVSPFARARDAAVADELGRHGIEAMTWWGNLVHEPASVTTTDGRVPRVFGAFHRRWARAAPHPWPDPRTIPIADDPGDGIPEIDGAPPVPAGEDAAHRLLDQFMGSAMDGYLAHRDDVNAWATSRLSVALHFGTISPRRIVDRVGDADEHRVGFVRQLCWRDWYAHLCWELPTIATTALQPDFDGVAWRSDPEGLEAWKAGRTGYPMVDAGMRELAETGQMHNRVRMITASFLVKDLLIDWRAGERWFRRMLIDGDLTQNAGNWQWVASTGADSVPYFRIFNPVRQSRTHDPQGEYLRRWLPELQSLGATAIHAPWEAPPLELAHAGVELGVTYPEPIVDHAQARVRAIAAYKQARKVGNDN